MTPLTLDEKKHIARAFLDLQRAIDSGADKAERIYATFRDTYRGDSRAYVDQFHIATDRGQWARQLRLYLEDEIGSGDVWLPGYTPHRQEEES